MLDGTHYFECQCGSNEHTLRFVYDKEDHEICTSIFLNHWQQWYKRWWVAIKYAFGHKSKHGHWDVWTLRNEDVDRLKALISQFESDNQTIPAESKPLN